tara:strand:- start:9111 stop:9398 length:288 start_codon:yes stop_codon:yes gene_type:complete
MDIKKNLTFFASTVIPILALIGTCIMWADTRYMHKEISDTRYLDLQIRIVQGHIRDYERLKSSGAKLSLSDESTYDMDKKQLDHLLKERNRLLGL